MLETLRSLPVGVLGVLSLPRMHRDRFRMLPVAATAGAGSLLIVAVVRALEIGPRGPGRGRRIYFSRP